jgi:hypothetical protein
MKHNSSRQLMEDLTLTSEELLEDLAYVSITGQMRDCFWAKMFEYFQFRYAYKTVKEEVESEIVNVLSEKKRMELSEVLKYMDKWISSKGGHFQQRYRDRWNKIVFHVVNDSDRIKLAWNEVWLSKEENKVEQA